MVKGCLEQPVQLLYPLELHSNEITSEDVVPRTEEIPSNHDIQSKPYKLNINSSEFRPNRTAAIIGSMKVNDMVANEADGK